MKYTIFRNKRDDSGITLQAIDANDLINKQKSDRNENIVTRYRDIFLALEKPENWFGYKKMARVCPVSEFYRNKAGERVWRAYNGVSIIEIGGLNGSMEVLKAKKEASLMPQVQYAFAGADGHSVVVLTVSSLPDGTLPKTEEKLDSILPSVTLPLGNRFHYFHTKLRRKHGITKTNRMIFFVAICFYVKTFGKNEIN